VCFYAMTLKEKCAVAGLGHIIEHTWQNKIASFIFVNERMFQLRLKTRR